MNSEIFYIVYIEVFFAVNGTSYMKVSLLDLIIAGDATVVPGAKVLLGDNKSLNDSRLFYGMLSHL